jgi:hypothetical protein
MSGTEGTRKFYMRAQAGTNDVRGVIVRYEPALEATMAPIVVAISGAFLSQQPTVASLSISPPARRQVEYSTGVIVSAAGIIVADREATDGCQSLVAGNFGNGERFADDKTSGLALVRVYGARDLKPLALGDVAKSDVTLVGIPEPQMQGGNAAVKATATGLLAAGDSMTLEPAAAQGMAGAAAMDSDAGFVGIVAQKSQVVAGPPTGAATFSLVPAKALRDLLTSQKVAYTFGHVSVDFAKDSVLRLICVRK